MNTHDLEKLKKMNDKLARMQNELSRLQHYTSRGSTTDDRSMQLYGDDLNGGIYLERIPNLKTKVFDLVLTEYTNEFNRLFKEYEDLTICKANGKVTTFKPVEL